MNIKSLVEAQAEKDVKAILISLLESHLSPAFGALPKREVDLNFLNALEKLGALNRDPTIYELVQKLRVTRSKARNLYYDRELRRLDMAELDRKTKSLLRSPTIQKDGDWFVLEIDNPLLSDHIRDKVYQIGCASDGSFSPSIVRLPLDAFVKLLDKELSSKDKKTVCKALEKAGIKADSSFRGLVKGALKKVGKKIADDAGEDLADKVPDLIGSLWDAHSQSIYNNFSEFLKGINKSEPKSD